MCTSQAGWCDSQKTMVSTVMKNSEIVQEKEFRGVIFPEEKRTFQWLFDPATLYWTPDRAAILKAEDLIAAYLKRNAPVIHKNLHKYLRQYAGVEIGNKRLVYINFFCQDHGVDWLNNEVIVKDGGDCYFQIKVDIGGEHCFNFRVNGEA
jgi:hypothetical protein